MMRVACLLVLAGCMTDPNGDTCAWTPGNDGFCPSDSGGSSGSKKIHTRYHSPAAVPFAGHVRVAMTRSRTDEPTQIETALAGAGEPGVTEPVLLGGEPLVHAIVPQLAAVGQRTYLVWEDVAEGSRHRGALLAGDGSLVHPITELGARDGVLVVAGERFVFVHDADPEGVVFATWIDRDGHRVEKTELVHLDEDGELLDISGGDGFLALATANADRAVVISRIADDGTVIDRTPIPFDGKAWDGQVVATSDGGVLAQFRVVADQKSAVHVVVVDADGTVTAVPSTLPQLADLVRVPLGIVAIAYEPATIRVLDEAGAQRGEVHDFSGRGTLRAIATADGFAVLHAAPDVAIAVTQMPGGVPAGRIEVAHGSVEELGCGCRTANPGTSALFAVALLVVLRRRRMLRRCKSPSSAPA